MVSLSGYARRQVHRLCSKYRHARISERVSQLLEYATSVHLLKDPVFRYPEKVREKRAISCHKASLAGIISRVRASFEMYSGIRIFSFFLPAKIFLNIHFNYHLDFKTSFKTISG